MSKFSGLYVTAPTPLRADGSLNLKLIEALADRWVAEGASGVYVGAMAGEFASLTMEERQRLTAWWAEIMRGKPLKLLVHVGHQCLADARQLAIHAEKVRADAITAVGPAYGRPTHVERMVACCEHIAAAAPRLPFFYDDLPPWPGQCSLGSAEFISLGRKRIPTLAGLIYNSADLSQVQNCLCEGGGHLDILLAREETLVAGLALGARSGVGATLAFAGSIYARLFHAFVEGDHRQARLEQSRASELVECCRRYGLASASKAVMAMVGHDCGPPRLPWSMLSPSQFNSLRNDLERIGFFDWIGPYHAHARTPLPRKLAGLGHPSPSRKAA